MIVLRLKTDNANDQLRRMVLYTFQNTRVLLPVNTIAEARAKVRRSFDTRYTLTEFPNGMGFYVRETGKENEIIPIDERHKWSVHLEEISIDTD